MANTQIQKGSKHAKDYDPTKDKPANTTPRHAAPLVGQVVRLRGGTSHMAEIASGFEVEAQ